LKPTTEHTEIKSAPFFSVISVASVVPPPARGSSIVRSWFAKAIRHESTKTRRRVCFLIFVLSCFRVFVVAFLK